MSTKRALINTAATAREAPHPLRRLQSEIGRGALPGARVCGRGAGDVRGSQTQGRAWVASRPRRWVGVERGRRREPPGPPEPGLQSPGGRAASARSRGGGEGENWGIWDAAAPSGFAVRKFWPLLSRLRSVTCTLIFFLFILRLVFF